MKGIILKDFLPKSQNLVIWFNAIYLIILLLLGKANSLTIVTAYFLETIVIGIIHACKMFTIISFKNSNHKPALKFSNYSMVLFFLIHFGFFITIQLIFVFVFLGISDPNIKEAFYIIQNLKYILSFKGMFLVIISIVMYNVVNFVISFLIPKKYKKTTLEIAFTEPYLRIFVQQFTVIISGFFIIFYSDLIIVAILLITFRTILELYFIANQSHNFFFGEKLNPYKKETV
jgi:hypothetical protein